MAHKSPATYIPPTGTLGYKPGTFTNGTSSATGATGTTGTTGAGLDALSGVGRLITPDQEEALGTDNFIGKYAGGKALEFGAKGAQYGGPVGAFVGATAGLGYGLIKGQDIQFDALNAKEKQTGLETAYASDRQKKEQEQSNNYTNMNKNGTMATKKSLAAMTGTVAHNTSAAQYKSAIKFSAIAKNMDKPIMAKGVVEDWEEGLGKARFGSDYDPKKADIA